MALSDDVLDRLAARVDEAAEKATLIPKLTAEHPLTLEEAYRVQRGSISLRKLRGDVVIGMKMGLTSKAKMEQMGVHQPIYGHLTSAMRLEDGGALSLSAHCHPRCEPEVAFLLGRELSGPVTPAEALLAVDGVCAALEIIDSRYEAFQFTLPDVVADNASSGRYTVGALARRPRELDLAAEECLLEVDGEVADRATGAAVLGHPAEALALAVNVLAERGRALEPGWTVLTGGMTDAVPLAPGTRVTARFAGLGTVTVRGS